MQSHIPTSSCSLLQCRLSPTPVSDSHETAVENAPLRCTIRLSSSPKNTADPNSPLRRNMSKKLFISIGSRLHFALDEADLVDGALIKFGEGINVSITGNGAAFTIVDDEVVAAMKPIIEFELASKTEGSSKTEESVIIDAEKKKVESESSLSPYVFKMGPSSKTARLTRTQRRNRSRRLRRMQERLNQERKLKEMEEASGIWSFCGDFGVC